MQSPVCPQRGGSSKFSLQSRLGCLALYLASVSNIWSLSPDITYKVRASELAVELPNKTQSQTPYNVYYIALGHIHSYLWPNMDQAQAKDLDVPLLEKTANGLN